MPDPMLLWVQWVLAVALHVLILAIAVWDTYAAFGPGPEYTVSAVLTDWAGRYLMLPFVAGVVIGHLLWGHFPKPPKSG